MKQEDGNGLSNGLQQKEKGGGGFVSIEKKISSNFARTILVCCIVLGVITSVLSYISSVNAVS
ncbi:MAG: hypothetical protein K1W26_12465 [Acetatifactor sp.]